MRHHLLGAVVGERQHRAAGRHQLLGARGKRGERVAGDEHRLREVLLAGVDVAAVELVLVGEGDGVHEEVELAPGASQLGEDRVHRGRVGDVAGHDELGAELGGERPHALFQRLSLVGERDLGALRRGGLGDAPGDRAVVRHAHDEALLASH